MKIRFHIRDENNELLETTEWAEELHREIAPTIVKGLRDRYGPQVFISTERDRTYVAPKPKKFRLNIVVKTGKMLVSDEEGVHTRDVSGMVLQTIPFPESERERMIAEAKEKFPDAVIQEVAV
jgi:hypothetical protein